MLSLRYGPLANRFILNATLVAGLVIVCPCIAFANCNIGGSPCMTYQNRTQVSAESVSSLTIPNHFVDATGLNQALMVCVAVQAAGQFPQRIQAAYNGDLMTLNVSNSSAGLGVAIFTMVDPDDGTNNAVISFQDLSGNPVIVSAVAAVAISMYGVSQSSPVVNGNFLDGTASPAEIALATRDGGVSVDVLAASPGALTTPAAGQTQNWTFGPPALTNLRASGSARENTATGSVLMTHALVPPTTPWIKAGVSMRPAAVTPAEFQSGDVQVSNDGALIQWRSGLDVENLGFHIYREDGDGVRTRITKKLIAGSSLVSKATLEARHGYSWFDPKGTRASQYWIEDIDMHGRTNLHGPFVPALVDQLPGFERSAALGELSTQDLNQSPETGRSRDGSQPLGFVTTPQLVSSKQAISSEAKKIPPAMENQWRIAAQASLKIAVRETGWYSVSFDEIARSGFETKIDPRFLQLFNLGQEQPIIVNGEQDGSFDPGDSIEFFAAGLDNAWSDTNVYWLSAGRQNGKRIKALPLSSKNLPASNSFAYTVELKERLVYFAALNNGDEENFFGQVISSQPAKLSLTTTNVDSAAAAGASLEVTLQGVTYGPHLVTVEFNGKSVGEISFAAKNNRTVRIPIPSSAVREGGNDVTLAAAGGALDVTVVDAVRLTYLHRSLVDASSFSFTTGEREGARLIGGFATGDIRIIDVTDTNAPQFLPSSVSRNPNGTYDAVVALPDQQPRNLIAFSGAGIKHPVGLELNRPSRWNATTQRADYLMITHADFADAVASLRDYRKSQGYNVAVVDVADLYDEFSFGIHSPLAVSSFLARARQAWQVGPSYALFVGDASYDPKNYFHLGNFDFVPTKAINTQQLEAVSDDALGDVTGDGIAELAIGRLPVRTAQQAQAVANKIVQFEQTGRASRSALLVSDINDVADFEAATARVRRALPNDIMVQEVLRQRLGDVAARDAILNGLSLGPGLVSYSGHGSVALWRGNLLTTSDVERIGNSNRLSVFVMANCLNGYFQDPVLASLGETLLDSTTGGAVAVWASSGITDASDQSVMMDEFYRQLFTNRSSTFGEAANRAKLSVVGDTRNTWILLGDPATRFQ